MIERDAEFKEHNEANASKDDDEAKRVVRADQTTVRGALERPLMTSTGAVDQGEGSTGSDRELPIPDYDELSVRGAKVRLDALNADELRRIRAHEEENKKRKTLIHEIDRRLR